MIRRSEGEPRLVVERQGKRLGLEAHHGVLIPVDDIQIRIGASHFGLEVGPHRLRLGPGQAALSSAEPISTSSYSSLLSSWSARRLAR